MFRTHSLKTVPKPLLYLLLTLLFEAPLYGVALRKKPWWQVLIFVVLINGFTHPLLTWAHHEWMWNLWVLEISVGLLEGLAVYFIFRTSFLKGIATGIFANAFSLFMGFLLMYQSWI